MSTEKKKFEVTQRIPASVYVTYLVEAENEDEAIDLVASQDPSIENIGENTYESEFSGEYTYQTIEL